MNQMINDAAYTLRFVIESEKPEDMIGQQTQSLVYALGGTADISHMTPGAAALYLLSLVLSQPQ